MSNFVCACSHKQANHIGYGYSNNPGRCTSCSCTEYDPKEIMSKRLNHEDEHIKIDFTTLPGSLYPDMVNHPNHYKSPNGLEVIDVIEGFNLNYYLGNCVKYICRAGKKDPSKELEDLNKAVFYLNRQISNLEKNK